MTPNEDTELLPVDTPIKKKKDFRLLKLAIGVGLYVGFLVFTFEMLYTLWYDKISLTEATCYDAVQIRDSICYTYKYVNNTLWCIKSNCNDFYMNTSYKCYSTSYNAISYAEYANFTDYSEMCSFSFINPKDGIMFMIIMLSLCIPSLTFICLFSFYIYYK